tara:strand:+ start:337 stop:450 length:114 start_codon:yes stop_codon:yes gene_type:complete
MDEDVIDVQVTMAKPRSVETTDRLGEVASEWAQASLS